MTRLKTKLMEEGRTIKWLANKINRTVETTSRYVNEKRIPRHDTVLDIAKWLNCNPDDIFLNK